MHDLVYICLPELPDGWFYLDGATGAPSGWKWAQMRGVSRFSDKPKPDIWHALVKQTEAA